MNAFRRIPTGFSLLEVVLAIGVFAIALLPVLGLLPGLARQGAVSTDALVAARLPDALRVELQRLATGGFDSLATTIPAMDASLASGFAMVATRDGSRLHAVGLPPPGEAPITGQEQYFLVECWRFPEEPLGYAPDCAVLAVQVRVSWPYRQPGLGVPVAISNREVLMFPASVRR
jgi:hypothetical protein